MITSLKLENFKGFVDETIIMGGVTLLSGLNNSGKSSTIQALRMFCKNHPGENPLLPGHGSVEEIRARGANADAPVCISICWTNGEQNVVEEQLILKTDGCEQPGKTPLACYVGADRFGPRMSLPIERSLGGMPCIGDNGEFVLDFLHRLENTLLPEIMHHDKSEGNTLSYEIQGWLHEIAPSASFRLTLDSQRDTSYAKIDNLRPTNVGFGISYSMPILAALLGMTAGPPHLGWDVLWGQQWEEMKLERGVLVMLENPEAHLHPKGQTIMGELIVKAAACGVQVVVETHSDHLMDGIRMAVKKGILDCDRVKFHFFERNAQDQCLIKSPKLHANGKLDFWPDGFFDQTMKNRAVLASRSEL